METQGQLIIKKIKGVRILNDRVPYGGGGGGGGGASAPQKKKKKKKNLK